jgi:hypothetical protein
MAYGDGMKRQSLRSTAVNPEAEAEFRKFQSATRRRKDEQHTMTVLGITADVLDALWKSKWAVKFNKRSDLYLAVLLHVNDKRACATCGKPSQGVIRHERKGTELGPAFLCPDGHDQAIQLKPLD